ncbi:e9imm peptide [Streptomyces sp. NPDC001222]|uniref:e9imm peptide n=1 Tax=Streptomyces sp. NPDC001222 TaxID=3364548 RepID=UPI0036D08DB0
MTTPRNMSREEGILLVQRLMDADYADEAEAAQIIAALRRGLGCPHISDYVFWDFDPQLTAQKVVDRALAYEPFAL